MTELQSTPPGDHFGTGHLQQDLRTRGLRGAMATVGGQAAGAVVQVASVVVLARLLQPSDFGVFGKTVALTGMIALIRTGGLSLATVQREHVTHRQISTLFWINVAFGLGCALAIAASAKGIAWFYHDQRLVPLVVALAGPCFLSSLGVQHSALLQRQLRFNETAAANLAAQLLGLAAAVVAAWSGMEYWAFVVQQYVVSAAVPLLFFVTVKWRPGRPGSLSEVKPLLSVGFHQTGFNVLNFASRNLDNVLIGRFISDAVLGFYSQAYRLLLLPVQQLNTPISSVVVPILSRLQHDPERFRRFYLKALGVVVFVGMPLIAFMLVDAEPIVLLALGGKWLGVAPIFRALGIAAFLGTFNIAGGWIFSSLGRTGRQLKWQAYATPATIVAFFLGLRWGAVGVALSFSIMQLVLTLPRLEYSYRGTSIRLRDALRVIAPAASASIVAGAVVAACHALVWHPRSATLPLDLIVFGGVYFLGWYSTRRGREELRSLNDLVRTAVGRA